MRDEGISEEERDEGGREVCGRKRGMSEEER